MIGRHFTSLRNLSTQEVRHLIDLTRAVKCDPSRYIATLQGKTLAMIFQKPSTRTRVSFQVAMIQTGGAAIVLNQDDLQLGRGESTADTARVLSRYVDGIVARVFAQDDVETLANFAAVPVINGLSDRLHPCQILCDFFTIEETFGTLKGVRVAYVGDGNNVAHSLAYGAAKLGVSLAMATPKDHAPDSDVIREAREIAKDSGAVIDVMIDPDAAVGGAHVVYTDVWTSMGQESEQAQRRAALAPYRVDERLFSQADPNAVFLHCLPAHRGDEVSAEVADSSRSIIFDQAENRLHSQKALLISLLSEGPLEEERKSSRPL